MNVFKPSETLPVISQVKPAYYHALGTDKPRGDAGRVMSRGELVKFAANPGRWKAGIPDKPTDATSWGSLVDTMALTPELFQSLYAIAPENYPASDGTPKPWNLNAKHCQEWEEAQRKEGKAVIKIEKYEEARIAVATLRSDERIADILKCSRTQMQVCVDYEDLDTGLVIPVKVLLDLVPNSGKTLGDLKTTNDASPRKWARHVFEWDLHTQAAMYTDAFNAATGQNRNQWLHVIQESSAPYATARRMLSDDYVQLGRAAYRNALRLYCQCLAADKWPGYDDEELNDGLHGQIINGWRVTDPEAWMVLA